MTASTAEQPYPLASSLARPSMRVVVLSDAEPDRNGVGSYYADLVVQLRGHVDSAVLFHPGNQASPGYRYLSAPLPGDHTQRISVPRPTHLWRAISQSRPTVIIVPTPGPFGLAGLLIARKLGIPLIVGFHTHYEALATLYWQNRFGFVCQRYLNWCNRLLFRHGAAVLANSPDMLRQAMTGGARAANLMGTSVPDEFVRLPAMPLNRSVDAVLFAGRLAGEKNLPDVLDAARRHPHIRFTIAGDGPMRSVVEQAAGELPNLDYLGWVARTDLLSLMDQHDVLLLPSKVESFGTVALEGMARGRLVIVTATCGISEWPQLADSLFIVADDETPSRTLQRLCGLSPEFRQALATQARQRAVDLNSWNISSWMQTLQRVQANAPSTLTNVLVA
ncbi:glycosyltransferase [Granulosicoccus sp. 3-233]|uniref:glycosyltransferase n=1 Tax=Granulosicoccus sp. 3-233 TaxID=3417969 RepID=UPI003D336857